MQFPGYPNQTHISPHVKWSEVHMDPVTTPQPIQARMIRHCFEVVEPIRAHFGRPVNFTSGYRSTALQRQLYEADKKANGGRPSGKVAAPGHSRHEFGDAVDIWIAGVTPAQIVAFALTLPAVGGVEQYPTFCHVDSRPRKPGQPVARW